MTQNEYDQATILLEDIRKLDESLVRVQKGIKVTAESQDEGQFLDIAALQGTLETAIQDAIDVKVAEFDAL